jgi:hypothetical protein
MMAAKKPNKEPESPIPQSPDAPQSNVDRLLKHLKKDSLATKLVQAHRDVKHDAEGAPMKPILAARLKEVYGELDKA